MGCGCSECMPPCGLLRGGRAFSLSIVFPVMLQEDEQVGVDFSEEAMHREVVDSHLLTDLLDCVEAVAVQIEAEVRELPLFRAQGRFKPQ